MFSDFARLPFVLKYMYMAKKILIANWKENPPTERQAAKLFAAAMETSKVATATTVICSPEIFLEGIAVQAKTERKKGGRAILGAQDVFWEEAGAHTSEAGPKMLKRLGVKYVIVGHSERRRETGETDAMVNKKVKAALLAGLRVVVCVGEPIEVRRQGVKAAQKFVGNQLKKGLKNVESASLLIAYEPIWAIGSGESDTPEDARLMAVFIKAEAARIAGRVKVLYGGSVNPKNVRDFVSQKEIDGALVGGASLHAGEWKRIVKKIGLS